MLQRIQTIWLLLATIITGLYIYFPLWSSADSPGMDELGAATQVYLLLIASLAGLIQFISIFLFKKRKLQITFCNVSIVMTLLFIIIFFLVFQSEVGDFSMLVSGIKIGALLPILVLLFNFLAIRGIKKDEAIVRSMDRLR